MYKVAHSSIHLSHDFHIQFPSQLYSAWAVGAGGGKGDAPGRCPREMPLPLPDFGRSINPITIRGERDYTLLVLIDFCPVWSELLTWSSVY